MRPCCSLCYHKYIKDGEIVMEDLCNAVRKRMPENADMTDDEIVAKLNARAESLPAEAVEHFEKEARDRLKRAVTTNETPQEYVEERVKKAVWARSRGICTCGCHTHGTQILH